MAEVHWTDEVPPLKEFAPPTSPTGNLRKSRRGTVRMKTVEQADEIDVLRASTQLLREQLLAERQRQQAEVSLQQRTPAVPHHAELFRLQDSAELYARKIETEKRRIEHLDAQLADVDAQLGEQRSRTGPYFSSEEAQAQAAKALAILEARLVTAQRRRNESVHANAQARAAIDSLRLQRLSHARLTAKLQRQLDELRGEMRGLVVASTQAYTARDQARAELAALSAAQAGGGDDAAAERERAEPGGRLAEADGRTRELGGGAIGRPAEPLTAAAGSAPQSRPPQPSAPRSAVGVRRMRRSSVESEGGGTEGSDGGSAGGLADSHEATFRQIVAVTGVTSLDELIALFEGEDEARAAQHAQARALSAEAAKLDEAIGEVRAEVDKVKGQGALNDAHRRKVQHDLTRRLAAAEEAASLYDARAQTAIRTLNALKGGVGIVFARLGCDTAEAAELVGSGGVSHDNLMSHLGLIEQRAHELLQMYAAAQAHALAGGQLGAAEEAALLANAMGAMIGPGPHVPAGASRAQIVPPTSSGGVELAARGLEADEASDDNNDEEPEDARPFSRDELRARTVRALVRKEKRQAAAAALSRGRAERTAAADAKALAGKDKDGAGQARAPAGGYRASGGARPLQAAGPESSAAPPRSNAAAGDAADKRAAAALADDDADARHGGRAAADLGAVAALAPMSNAGHAHAAEGERAPRASLEVGGTMSDDSESESER